MPKIIIKLFFNSKKGIKSSFKMIFRSFFDKNSKNKLYSSVSNRKKMTVDRKKVLQSYLVNPWPFRCFNTKYGLFFTIYRIIRSFKNKNQKDTKNTD
jgi:hypothetical protein